MTLALLVYLASFITSFASALTVIFAVTACLYVLYTIGYLVNNELAWSKRPKYHKWPLAVILSTMFIITLLPSERTMWMMAGAYTAQTVVESTVGKRTIELVELKLQEELDKMKEKVQK